MRIISGTLGGRRLNPPRNIPARPTTDIAKVALFNILSNYIDFANIKYLDLFSGTGAISFEMYSRGCRDITMVDLSHISVDFQKKSLEDLKISTDNIKINKGDAIQYLKSSRQTFDLIFAGPPYALDVIDEIPDMVIQHPHLLAENGWFILETSHKHNFVNHPNLLQVRNYGQTHFWFFSHHQQA
ncbi:MAG: RsmD family RNA methyltransferase [Chitinophagales bacterium]|nr:RsmD family RNA methyltransferase [Chitinophagales bacterium]MCZ2393339.1 RsmD family RNA methyltransferase [Chitinophagales bacterium]